MGKVTVTKTFVVPKNKIRYEFKDLILDSSVNTEIEAIRNKRLECQAAGQFVLTKTITEDESDSTKVRVQTVTVWNNEADHQAFVDWIYANHPNYITNRDAWESSNGVTRSLNITTE